MYLSKNKALVILALIIVNCFSIEILQPTQNLLATVSATQIMHTQMLATSTPSITQRVSNTCSQNQVQSSSNICIKPQYIQGCQTYQTASTCNKCATGYVLNKNKKCDFQSTFIGTITHILGCIKQNNDTCEVCGQGFYIKQNKCHLGVKNCASYNKDGQCTQCEHDYSLILSQCRKNSLLGCKYQTDQHTCKQCYAPFVLNGQHCDVDQCRILNDYGCVSCQCGYYLTAERDCKPIATGCLRYEKGVCKDCLPHYKLKGGVCEIQGCVEYTGNYCKKCSDKYDLIDGECQFKNCLDWLNDQCITCKPGFGLKNGLCVTAQQISCS